MCPGPMPRSPRPPPAPRNRTSPLSLPSWTLARAAIAGADPDACCTEPEIGQISLRPLLNHTIEEYARHIGHADLLRGCIDGVTGEYKLKARLGLLRIATADGAPGGQSAGERAGRLCGRMQNSFPSGSAIVIQPLPSGRR